MRRTAFSVFAGAALLHAGSSQPAASQSTLDHRELAADQQVIHALNRLTFGAKPGDATRVREMGLDKWVELQLHPERIADVDIDRFLSRYSVLEADQNELLRSYTAGQRERRFAA